MTSTNIKNIAPTVSAIGVSYRHKRPDGSSATSKISLSLDIYGYLCVLFGDEKSAKSWVSANAGSLKEKYGAKTSSYIREASLMMIIDDTLLEGYEIDPEYTLYQSKYLDEGIATKYSPVNIPSAMKYAMNKMNLKYTDEVDKLQQRFRDEKDFSCNYSDSIRSELLKRMVFSDLIV